MIITGGASVHPTALVAKVEGLIMSGANTEMARHEALAEAAYEAMYEARPTSKADLCPDPLLNAPNAEGRVIECAHHQKLHGLGTARRMQCATTICAAVNHSDAYRPECLMSA